MPISVYGVYTSYSQYGKGAAKVTGGPNAGSGLSGYSSYPKSKRSPEEGFGKDSGFDVKYERDAEPLNEVEEV
ncbi:hypothetical protein LTR56_000320 [Elasticomyces elasticus]|nr:hypothetical protein LTR56_000320 [Elasticomyces elasticus]KAK3666984.1 hypothetical protein LTR22_002209 [Elasticomyces elasticus]KAK4933312.1 hypothetical protein LTR49_000306 [Elasticomyces elasticus]KAK5757334.1 hypothetical protein LTS12_012546 [Elasticomyces elasticus]